MKNFNEHKWSHRYKTMGDTAESAFLMLYPHAHRMGINRPDFSVASLPKHFRHTPDYLLPAGFYEVMGVSSRSKDPTLKLKFDKLDSLKIWTLLGPGFLWVWDSHRKRYWCATIEEWAHACAHHATVDYFSDNNKPYWNLGIECFPCEPTVGLEMNN
jgi:hypothetical protein